MNDSGTNKFIGYLLLVIGIIMIGYSVFNVYQVFTGKTSYFKLLEFAPVQMDLTSFVPGAPVGADLTQELVSSDLLSRPLNLVAHILLMGFVAASGHKLAMIGTTLVRTIKVNVKEERSVLFPPR